ncbi:hypothetical protein GCM10010873_25110 [Cypionkella aquatica]|uniref:Uncharacterized protein n=1 Tax=Cypionkella aquatica TaxID=1756042 RepID=A0AA37U0A5_9RHOB|nr:hypothetical protein GCM10010873_25110 [Cypionkella aquatica]
MACRTIDRVSRSPAEMATPSGLASPACASKRGFGFGLGIIIGCSFVVTAAGVQVWAGAVIARQMDRMALLG